MDGIFILIIFLFIIIISFCYFISICLGTIYYIKKKDDSDDNDDNDDSDDSDDSDDICDTEDSTDLFIKFMHRVISIPVYVFNLFLVIDSRDIIASELLDTITYVYDNRYENSIIPPFVINPEVLKPEIITRLTNWMNERRIVSSTDQQRLLDLQNELYDILIDSLDCSNEIKNNEIRSKVRNCLNLYNNTYGDEWILEIYNEESDPYNVILPMNCP